jgi:hypothetical protein
MNDEKKLTTGRILITIMALFTCVSPYLADWNITHIYNPTWPPHAKFHNAQTMCFGALLGLASLYCLWIRKKPSELERFNQATFLAALYWIAQVPAITFPGTALTDPNGYQGKMPMVFGIEFNQVVMDLTILFPIIIFAYYIERKRITNQ